MFSVSPGGSYNSSNSNNTGLWPCDKLDIMCFSITQNYHNGKTVTCSQGHPTSGVRFHLALIYPAGSHTEWHLLSQSCKRKTCIRRKQIHFLFHIQHLLWKVGQLFFVYSLLVCFINQLVSLHVVNDDVSHLAAWEDASFSKQKENLIASPSKRTKWQQHKFVSLSLSPTIDFSAFFQCSPVSRVLKEWHHLCWDPIQRNDFRSTVYLFPVFTLAVLGSRGWRKSFRYCKCFNAGGKKTPNVIWWE